ncbi:MAG: dTMP kinase [Candidatus Woesearchaeota archaeon]
MSSERRAPYIAFEGIDGCGKSTQIDLLKDFLHQRGLQYYLTREPGGGVVSDLIRKLILHPDLCAGSQMQLFEFMVGEDDYEQKINPVAHLFIYLTVQELFSRHPAAEQCSDETAENNRRLARARRSLPHLLNVPVRPEIDFSGFQLSVDDTIDSRSPVSNILLFSASRAQVLPTEVGPRLESGILVVSDRCYLSSLAYQGYGEGLDLSIIEELSMIACQGITPDLVFLIDTDPKVALGRIHSGRKKEFGKKDVFEERLVGFLESVAAGYRQMATQSPARFRTIQDIPGEPKLEQKEVRKELEQFLEEWNS